MKKRLFAVLVAVCLVMSSCVLFASAAPINFKSGSYLIGEDDSLKIAKDGSDYDKAITITAKDNASLAVGTTTLSAEDIDAVFTFKSGSTTVKYKGNLDKHVTITAKVDDEGNVVITDVEQKVYQKAYVVKTAFDEESPTTFTKCKDYLEEDKIDLYLYDDLDVMKFKGVTNKVELVAKLLSLTTGVRFFGSTYNNLVASEIAKVTAQVNRLNGSTGSYTFSVTNKIDDLMTGDEVILTASLKDMERDGEYYGFYCWVDGSGKVLSTANAIKWIAGSGSSAVYATFVELKDRVEIDYSAGENGSILYNEAREIFKGDGQISIMEGREATFTFVPNEGYEVASVFVDGKDVASFKNIDLSKVDLIDLINGIDDGSGLKQLINATNKEVYSYTFTGDDLQYANGNHTIEVTFQKIAVLEAPSGKDMPTVAPEGITLATGVYGDGAEDAEGDGAATTVPAEGGANGGSSSNGGVVNPQTGSASAIAVFAVLSVAAGAAFVTSRKKD